MLARVDTSSQLVFRLKSGLSYGKELIKYQKNKLDQPVNSVLVSNIFLMSLDCKRIVQYHSYIILLYAHQFFTFLDCS